jgi:calcium-dependent protein kinase
MAPEFYSASEYNMKVDVWALGVIFHEMLFGQLFFLDGATTAFQV